MKQPRKTQKQWKVWLLSGLICCLPTVVQAVDINNLGVAEPPFLSFGVKANLLLVLDNSGSMLDTAYADSASTQCYDDSYDSTAIYTGNFTTTDSIGSKVWYEWQDGDYTDYQYNSSYTTGSRVYVKGIIYEAESSCTSNGAYLNDDTECTWNKLYDVDVWQQNFSYSGGDLVIERKQLYRAQASCTSSSDLEISDDSGCDWTPVDYTWQFDEDYTTGDVVTFNGRYYQALTSVTAQEDKSESVAGWEPVYPDVDSDWDLLDEGGFVEVSGGVADVTTYCDSAAGSKDSEFNDDLCLRSDASKNPVVMAKFVATGSFLNWATASKFDIQKKILTGGKYDSDLGIVISESRGCAGVGYVKETALDSGNVLTLRVRGSFTEDGEPNTWDWVDTTDDTMRLEILAVSTDGFDVSSCQDAIDKIITVGSGFQSDVDACLSGTGDEERAALNHAMQYCWQDTHVRNLKTIASDCEGLYDSLTPGQISAYNDAYNCYGVYDENYDHDNRTGYVGRCYDTGTAVGASTCDPVPRDIGYCDWTAEDPCEGFVDGALYRQSSTNNYVEKCSKLHSSGNKCQNDKSWEIFYTDSLLFTECDPTDSKYDTTGAEWQDLLYPGLVPDNDPIHDPDYDVSLIPANPGIGDGSDGEWWCIYQAMEDYCADLTVPEVIDPTDQVSETTDYWGIPGNLVDAGVMSQLGVEQPLATMKGFIAVSAAPEGVVTSVKNDLRIGVMAFNENGSKTECLAEDTSDVVDEYCPKLVNKDGAEIKSNIMLGSTDIGDGKEHIDLVVEEINDTRATSWTPLAEALYTAIGYYTQRADMRWESDDYYINDGDWENNTSYETGDVVGWLDGDGNDIYYQATSAGISLGTEPGDDTGVSWVEINNPDPITNWCQENHILIITEGASTADINQDVIDYVDSAAIDDGDQADDLACVDDLNSSTYLDDLAYIAYNSSAPNLYGSGYQMSTGQDSDGDGLLDLEEKQNITTHIVVSGSLRDENDTECSPDELIRNAATNGGSSLLMGESPEALEEALLEKFNELRKRSSAGSAASVISSSRGGEGAIYQAIFWPELNYTHDNGTEYSVAWAGDVHAMFISNAGYMYEDTNGDRILNPSEDIDGDGVLDVHEDTNNDGILDDGEDVDGDGKLDISEDTNGNGSIDGDDLRVVIYYDELESSSRGCYNTEVFDSGICSNSKPLNEIQFLWTAAEWLNSSSLVTADNRNYLSKDHKRYIFTWIDLNNNGIVDDDHDGTVGVSDEIRPFIEGMALDSGVDLTVSGTRSKVYADFGVSSSAEVDNIVGWIRGKDSVYEDIDDDGLLDPGEDLDGDGLLDVQRSREIPDSDGGTTLVTYRLADVIHSTPMTVSEPAEGYHFLYRDRSYATYVSRYKNRRHMIYFGSNGGMLHAVNGGFYIEDDSQFCLTGPDENGNCTEAAGNDYPELGAEMWAYVPYNIIPHLSSLMNENYSHKYYVDLRPRIFDVKIFSEEGECSGTDGIFTDGCVHPNGWGTILVGGMRLGGANIDAFEVTPDAGDTVLEDNRKYISSYFVLDITNPEEPPVLLGELTQTLDNSGNEVYVDLGHSTVIPAMVSMKNPAVAPPAIEENSWYLILGSGPEGDDYTKGMSTQDARVSVLPLSWFGATDVSDSSGKTALRIPATAPVSGSSGGTFVLGDSPKGFVSDIIAVDFDIDPSTYDYMTDALYFGTTEGEFITNADETTEWDGGGHLYRLVTRNLTGDISGFGAGFNQTPTTPDAWKIYPMLDLTGTDKPISASANLGYDGYNFWVYIGTGRFWDPDDKTDANQQTYFGLREPMLYDSVTGYPDTFLWDEIEFADNIDPVTGKDAGLSANEAGDRGLLRTDDILVGESTAGSYENLSCRDNSDTENGAPLSGVDALNCVPENIRLGTTPDTARFNDLEDYIAGYRLGSCDTDNASCADGWYKDFWPYSNRERNVGQATMLGGLVTFTTYQPYSDVCQPEGEAFLYGVYYKTGTSWYENIFGDNGVDQYSNVENKLDLGRGLATTPSLHTGSEGEEGPRGFVQTSTGEIKEIQQTNLPIKAYKSGRSKWKEYIP